MSEYLHVEKPFLDQLATLGWTVIDQGHGMIPSDPAASLRDSFREWLLPEVFRNAVRSLNRTAAHISAPASATKSSAGTPHERWLRKPSV